MAGVMCATSDDFRETVAAWLEMNPELLVLNRLKRQPDATTGTPFDAFGATAEDREWVVEWMRDRLGRKVAFGRYPNFPSDDPAVAIDAVLPAPDGSVTVGIY